MRFLTAKQKQWLIRREIKVGCFYPFPPMGFTVYAEPKYTSGAHIQTNPFTKSLAGEYFLVKEIENGFCKGNFYERPKGRDMYLTEESLSRRTLVEMLFLFLLSFIPLATYNLLNGGVVKMESMTKQEP